MPLDLRFSFRLARPYLPCAPRSAQKLKTRRQYAPDLPAGRLRRPELALFEGIADFCFWRAAEAFPRRPRSAIWGDYGVVFPWESSCA